LFRGANVFFDSGHVNSRAVDEATRMSARRSAPRPRAARAAGPAALTASFATVRAAAGNLPEVEHTTMYGSPAMKLRGRLLACMATNKVAEPDTLVISVGFDQRDALIAAEPAIYYLKDHYQTYPVVLVRLARIQPEALASLVREAWHFVNAERPRGGRQSM
jgi:hypothetical protein